MLVKQKVEELLLGTRWGLAAHSHCPHSHWKLLRTAQPTSQGLSEPTTMYHLHQGAARLKDHLGFLEVTLHPFSGYNTHLSHFLPLNSTETTILSQYLRQCEELKKPLIPVEWFSSLCFQCTIIQMRMWERCACNKYEPAIQDVHLIRPGIVME